MTPLRVVAAVASSMVLTAATFVAQLVIPDAYAGPLLVGLVLGFAGLIGWIVRSLVALESRVSHLEGSSRE